MEIDRKHTLTTKDTPIGSFFPTGQAEKKRTHREYRKKENMLFKTQTTAQIISHGSTWINTDFFENVGQTFSFAEFSFIRTAKAVPYDYGGFPHG